MRNKNHRKGRVGLRELFAEQQSRRAFHTFMDGDGYAYAQLDKKSMQLSKLTKNELDEILERRSQSLVWIRFDESEGGFTLYSPQGLGKTYSRRAWKQIMEARLMQVEGRTPGVMDLVRAAEALHQR